MFWPVPPRTINKSTEKSQNIIVNKATNTNQPNKTNKQNDPSQTQSTIPLHWVNPATHHTWDTKNQSIMFQTHSSLSEHSNKEHTKYRGQKPHITYRTRHERICALGCVVQWRKCGSSRAAVLENSPVSLTWRTNKQKCVSTTRTNKNASNTQRETS